MERRSLGVLFIILLMASLDYSIILNLPLLRAFLGFLFLAFVPGFLLLQFLPLREIRWSKQAVISIGLSISILYFIGIILNNLFQVINIERPLDTWNLLLCLNLICLLLILGLYLKKTDISIPKLSTINRHENILLSTLLLIIAGTIFGIYLQNEYDINKLLLITLLAISVFFILVCIFRDHIGERTYPALLLLLGLVIPLSISLRSSHLIGIDIHVEYYFFQTALEGMQWNIIEHSTLDSCLSISLLPTIYFAITGIPPELLYKILYSTLLSISPVIVYFIANKYLNEIYSFLAATVFMIQQNYIWIASNARMGIALLFLLLILFVLFEEGISQFTKRVLMIMFIFSIVFSHYTTTYIAFISLSLVIIFTFIKGGKLLNKSSGVCILILFAAVIFLWYSLMETTTFGYGVGFVKQVGMQFNEFLLEETRSTSTYALLGKNIGEKAIPHQIEFICTWILIVTIGLGVISQVFKFTKCKFDAFNPSQRTILRKDLDMEYVLLGVVFSILLLAIIIVPYVSVGFGLDRLFFITSGILSIFFVIGAFVIFRFVTLAIQHFFGILSSVNHSNIGIISIILLILCPYFLCTAGVMYQAFDIHRSIALNNNGEQYDIYFIQNKDEKSTIWLKNHFIHDFKIYADFHGTRYLISQGNIRLNEYNIPDYHEIENNRGYIFIRTANINGNNFLKTAIYNNNELIGNLKSKDLLYNSGAQIYY